MRTPVFSLLMSVFIMCLFGAAAVAVGQTAPPAPAQKKAVQPEDYFTLAHAVAVRPSPDGKWVAWVELRWNPEANARNGDLWVATFDGKDRRRLTFDPAFDGSPTWSPDSGWIYFSSARKRAGETKPPHDGKNQVWRVRAEGGAPAAVTRVVGGVGQFALSASGTALYYTRSEKRVDDDFKALKTGFGHLQYGHGVTRFDAVWMLDLTTWRSTKLVPATRVIKKMAVSPDGARIAMVTAPDRDLITYEGRSHIDVWDVRGRSATRLEDKLWRAEAPSPFGWLDTPAWSADSKALAFDVAFDGYPAEVLVAEWSAGGTVKIRRLERPDGVHVAPGHLEWRGQGRNLCFVGEIKARARLYSVSQVTGTGQGPLEVLTPAEDLAVSTFGVSAGGDVIAAEMSTPTAFGDVFVVGPDAQYKPVTRLNPQVETWKLPKLSVVKWKGAGGVEVEGVLELPADHPAGKPLAMIVEIHGGPTAASLYRQRFWIYGRTMLSARGYAVFSPNYRGSTGYGDAFMTDLVGQENRIEVEDILRGVEAMVERGIADPDRLGVMGWSNGGLLTNCLIGATTRFKAASSGAGIIDMVIQWGLEDTPGHVVNFMGASLPWEDPEQYRISSPLYNLGKVKTPTLIHVGGADPRCPPGHSRTLYRALRHYLNVPAELVIYPGEGHGLSTYKNRLAKMKWDLAWFARYLPVK